MKYSEGDIMAMPMMLFLDSRIETIRKGVGHRVSDELRNEAIKDYRKRRQESVIAAVVQYSCDFAKHYPNSTLTNRQIITEATIMALEGSRS